MTTPSRKGFSLVEALLVIGIVGAVAGMSAQAVVRSRQRAALTTESEIVLQALREVQSRSLTAHGGSTWGFTCAGSAWQRFALDGDGAEVGRETFPIASPQRCTISQPDVRFAKLTGIPAVDVAITITSPGVGEKRIAVIAPGTFALTTL